MPWPVRPARTISGPLARNQASASAIRALEARAPIITVCQNENRSAAVLRPLPSRQTNRRYSRNDGMVSTMPTPRLSRPALTCQKWRASSSKLYPTGMVTSESPEYLVNRDATGRRADSAAERSRTSSITRYAPCRDKAAG